MDEARGGRLQLSIDQDERVRSVPTCQLCHTGGVWVSVPSPPRSARRGFDREVLERPRHVWQAPRRSLVTRIGERRVGLLQSV